jgi:hypothetical protein
MKIRIPGMLSKLPCSIHDPTSRPEHEQPVQLAAVPVLYPQQSDAEVLGAIIVDYR